MGHQVLSLFTPSRFLSPRLFNISFPSSKQCAQPIATTFLWRKTQNCAWKSWKSRCKSFHKSQQLMERKVIFALQSYKKAEKPTITTLCDF